MPSNNTTNATFTGTTVSSGGVTTSKLATAGAEGMRDKLDTYARLLETRGIGTHYGDHSSFARMNYTERLDALRGMVKPGQTAPAPNDLKQTSCIGWALETVVTAYEKAGRGARGRQIAAIVTGAYVDPSGKTYSNLNALGGVLMRELQKDGWTSLFWAKDSKNPDYEGSSDREVHRGYVRQAMNQKRYWVSYPYETMRVDDYVMDFSPSSDTTTPANMSALEKLRKVPYAVGVAKGGQHCFTVRSGKVIENHWSSGPDSNLEGIFQETDLKDWSWSSGLIMVPPGAWK